MIARFSRTMVAHMMSGASRKTLMNKWSQLHKKIPMGYQNQELFVQGGFFVSAFYQTQQHWEYFATAHPYQYRVGQHTLEGTVDALRVNQDKVVQIVSVGRRCLTDTNRGANDIVGVLNRGVFAKDLQRELRTIGTVQSVLVTIPDAVTVVVNDSRRIRDRTQSYLGAILRGIEHKVFYPRYQSCSSCGYQPVCDTKWCTARAQSVPRKTARAIQEILKESVDEKTSGRGRFNETARQLRS
jgi:hypothetical protein